MIIDAGCALEREVRGGGRVAGAETGSSTLRNKIFSLSWLLYHLWGSALGCGDFLLRRGGCGADCGLPLAG